MSDDPGFQFCQEHPQIISSLQEKSVFELGITEKLKILGAMMNQMLTFAGVRDELVTRIESTTRQQAQLMSALHCTVGVSEECQHSVFGTRQSLQTVLGL